MKKSIDKCRPLLYTINVLKRKIKKKKIYIMNGEDEP